MDEFIRVAAVTDVADPGKELIEVDGEMVALFHVGGTFYAIDDVCTHDGGPLVDGELTDHAIACPRHGAKFDIRSGAALSMPAVRPTRAHEVKVEDGNVFVRLRQQAAGPVGQPAAPPAATPVSHSGTSRQETAASSPAPAEPVPPVEAGGLAAQTLSESLIREMLKEVKDPELFVNIVDLGLIYNVSLAAAAEGDGQQVSIDMTMTSPACPAGPQLIADTKRVVSSHNDVSGVEVRIVMDPPWTPDRMTDDARDQLGIF